MVNGPSKVDVGKASLECLIEGKNFQLEAHKDTVFTWCWPERRVPVLGYKFTCLRSPL